MTAEDVHSGHLNAGDAAEGDVSSDDSGGTDEPGGTDDSGGTDDAGRGIPQHPPAHRAAPGSAAPSDAEVSTADSTDAAWLARAVELATANVAAGGGPFGALIVRDGVVIAEGVNRVTANLDPTAHAEVTAIRAACQAIGDFSLVGTTLYTSCEPCPLCLSASLWARIERIVFAADRHDAARGGFDDLEFYELFARDRSTWPMHVDALRPPNAPEPFDAWLASERRTDY